MLKYVSKAILALFQIILLSANVAAAPVQDLDCQFFYWFELKHNVPLLSIRTDVHRVRFISDCSEAHVEDIASYDSNGARDEAFRPFRYRLFADESNRSRLIGLSPSLKAGERVEIHLGKKEVKFIYSWDENAPITVNLNHEKPKYPKREFAGLICDAIESTLLLSNEKVKREFYVSLFEDCGLLFLKEGISSEKEFFLDIISSDPPIWENGSHGFKTAEDGRFIYYPKNGGDEMILSFPPSPQ